LHSGDPSAEYAIPTRRAAQQVVAVTVSELLAVLGMAALWGGSFLFMRVAVPEFGPVPLIFVRVVVAGLCLLPFLVARGEWPELRRRWRSLLWLALLNAALPFPLFAYATGHLSAGFASILNATAPLFAAIVAALWLGDRLSPRAIAGLAIGFAGVVLLAGDVPALGPGAALAIGAALLASCCYGISASYVKRHLPGASPWVTTTGGFGLAAPLLAPVTALTWPAEWPGMRAWVAVVLLAIACTSIPNISYFKLLQRAGPTRAMTVAFLIPAFGMLWGALALDEVVTMRMLAGCAVILAGTALVTLPSATWARLLGRGAVG
jgi:drug/metabolite transporter (DMT)-like permease